MESCMEVFANTYLPRIRAAVAQELSFMGMTQREIASRLYVTQSSVSQYLRNIRGKGSLEDEFVRKDARQIAKTLSVRVVDRDDLLSVFMLSFTRFPHDCLPSWFCQELQGILERRGFRL